MLRRLSFDTFRDVVFLAVLCGGVFEGLLVLVGPPVTACFCPVYPAPCPCPRPIPAGLSASIPWLTQVWSVLVMALVPLSLLVGLVGIYLGRRAAARGDVHMVRGLKLCPLLTLLFLEVLTYVVILYPYPLPGVLPR